jgi:signal transduction histidine kinase
MAAIVAHEVRNPLNAIRGAAHYLEGECDDGLRSYVHLIEEQVDRVSKVTASLLDFSKPLVLEFRRGSVGPVIEQALVQVEGLLRDKKIRVQKDIASRLPTFPHDPAQVERALVNLLTNAAEAMEARGLLRIVARRPVGERGEPAEVVEVVVEDDGGGLGAKDAEELFKPFFTTKLSGTGLGLAIVRKIMDCHQGEVRLEPGTPRGTRAVLTFPAKLKVYEKERQHFGYR